ncbi:hypothetical protein [Rhizobium sp. ZW T2_16]|uniref:hypothetical protein n=1 Tax=Rhizobium sp. ZW T2_16 TaxID=3378083 RepID=UPI0038540D5F
MKDLNVSRRGFLGGVAITAIPSAAIAIEVGATHDQPMTAQERFDFHLSELKRAAEELDPRIGDWLVRDHTSAGEGCSILISAFRTTGWYEGDGLYEAGKKNWNGSKTEYKVRLLADQIDGERLFEVTCPGERMQLIETRLNTFIGRRIA